MREELKNYIKNPSTSLLLCGPKGLFIEETALEIASAVLNTTVERLSFHPDYLYVDCGKEKTIGVEKAELILTKASLSPSISEKIVVVISEMNKMTEQAQNKLLKLIEESSSVVVIATAYNNAILETIKSRCRVIQYKPYTKEEFSKYCAEHQISDSDVLYFVTSGCPGLIKDNANVIKLFKDISASVKADNVESLLDLLNLRVEKDANNFFEKNRDLVRNLYLLLVAILSEKLSACLLERNRGRTDIIQQKLTVLEDHLERCSSVAYTKDNFFLCIATLITLQK